jgi:hypothetical protein
MKRSLKISSGLARTLVERGLALEIDGLLVPALRGGDPAADLPFPAIPEDFAALDAEALDEFIAATADAIARVTGAPAEFVSEAVSASALYAAAEESVEALEDARAEAASRVDPGEFAALGERAVLAEAEPEPDPEPEPEPAPEAEPEAEPEPDPVEPPDDVVASARVTPSRPARSRASTPVPAAQSVELVAAAGAHDTPLGRPYGSMMEIAEAMCRRHAQFGTMAKGQSSQETIARADWSSLYGHDRTLTGNWLDNMEILAAALDPAAIKAEMKRRKGLSAEETLLASGGLCAPVTPYYQLQMIAMADRPVRAALANFNADRGGIRAARPAALSAVTTAVGSITAANDAEGGTFATKTCQRIECPDFDEVDVETIYHCLEFGNLGARTFPELVVQWNELVLAAHARLAETHLLNGIDNASTQVTAQSLGLGATGALFGQILAAANGMRSRNRMADDAVLRLLIPFWALDLLVSDVIRSQFERFDTDEARVTAILRSFNVEPSFYKDSAAGRGQVFDVQEAGALLPFPESVVWYLYPEGSFLYLDGGTLELGLVRDSVLNATNDFQLFGETFENVAFVGVESLAVESTICDSGTVSLPAAIDCPIDYTHTS